MSSIEALLIDDDEDFCASVKAFLKRKKIDLLTISSPQIAAALDFEKVRLVLLDIDMPGLTGDEVLRQIRQRSETSVIMISGHSDERTRVTMLKDGADFFLAKPVNLEELYLVADRILRKGRAAAVDSSSWALQRSTMLLNTPDGRQIGLSASEFRGIETLIRRAPDHIDKTELLLAMSSKGESGSSSLRALEVMLSRLRSRASTQDVILPIRAIRNAGYVFHGSGKITQ